MGKNKLKKFAEMDTLPNVFQPIHKDVYNTDYHLKGRWKSDVFKNNNPIVLEVGCGKGEYSVALARMYPEKNFIGLDMKGSRMWHGAKEAIADNINNVVFLRTHAEVLASMFEKGEISEIWITFPDPQMSKVKKRLTGTRFLGLYQRIMNGHGLIHLKTDSPFLYTYTREMIKENALQVNAAFDDLYGGGCTDPILSIQTFYEKQWLNRGKLIKYLQFVLPDTLALKEPEIEIEKDDYHSQAQYMVPH